MRDKVRFVVLALGATLSVSVASAQSVPAQEPQSARVYLTPSRDSGVSGVATLTGQGGGVRVDLQVRGLPEAGVEHINHFHAGGTCADDRAGRTAPVTVPLDPVVAREDGTGSASTVLDDVALDELIDGSEERFLLLHARAEGGVPPGIACADLLRAEDDAPAVLPDSGGTSPVLLPGILVALGVCMGLAALRRPGGPR